MTKEFSILIDRYQAGEYLKAVRSKKDVIVLWMETIKNFIVSQPTTAELAEAELTILIGSMSRLFCTLGGGGKIFSIAFPFGVTKSEDQYVFHTREGVEIDSRVSSIVISLLQTGNLLGAQDFGNFLDPILENSDSDPQLWALVRELMLAEDGYLRYDFDEVRRDGHRHPLHHIDVNYSNGGSFKVGLNNSVDRTTLTAILDSTTDCHYLRPFTG